MTDGLNCSNDDGGDAYLLQIVAIHFNHKVKPHNKIYRKIQDMENFQDMEGLVFKRVEIHVEIQDMEIFQG